MRVTSSRAQSILHMIVLLSCFMAQQAMASTTCTHDPDLNTNKASELSLLYQQGEQLYLNKDFVGAIQKFQKVLGIALIPNVVYNLAQSHKKLRNHREAKEYFSWFLDIACDLSAVERVRIAEIIDDLTKKIRDEEVHWDILLKQRHRPKWRIALGIVSIAGGVALVSLGGVFASVHGQSVLENGKEDFTRIYNTQGLATGLIVPGSLTLVGGGMLIALPNKRSSDSGIRSRSAPAGTVTDAGPPLIRY